MPPKHKKAPQHAPVQPANRKPPMAKPRPRSRPKASRRVGVPRLSADGLAMLKAAFALPDFSESGCRGITDMFCGKTNVIEQSLQLGVQAAGGFDTYFLFAPQFGVAYATASVVIGNSLSGVNWQAFDYPDSLTYFPSGATTTNFTKARYAGLAGELISTMNEMTWAGSIQVARVPISCPTTVALTGTPAFVRTLNGFKNIDQMQRECFSGDVRAGAYSIAVNRNADFQFTDITGDSVGDILTDYGGAQMISQFRGLDMNFDTLLFRVTVPVGSLTQSFMLRSWSVVEYQPIPSSIFYNMAERSAAYDLNALLEYHKVACNIPIAVVSALNDSFWQRVLNIIRTVSGPLSLVPGPIGGIATGVSGIANAISSYV
jgi:hypothetical protein